MEIISKSALEVSIAKEQPRLKPPSCYPFLFLYFWQ